MRRTAPAGPLSPKLIKHFAVTTVALTGLLALFSSGEDWGARSQIGAVEARNRLVTIDAEKFGANRLAAKIKISEGPKREGFNEDPGMDFGERGGSSSTAPQPAPLQPGQLAVNDRADIAESPGTPNKDVFLQRASSATNARKLKASQPRAASPPTEQQIANITAGSASRSGQAASAQ